MKTNLTLKQLEEAIAERSAAAAKAYEEAGPELDFSKVTCLGDGDTKSKVEKLEQFNAELSDYHDDITELRKLAADKGMATKAAQKWAPQQIELQTKDGGATKSIGEMMTESPNFEQKHVKARLDVDLKTLFQTSAGWDPEATRISRVSLYPLQPLGVLDYIPMGSTNADTIKYMKESTFTNNAAEASAGGAYGEAALALTETSDEVEKIAVWLPATDEQLEDVPGIQAYINNRLTYMLKSRLEDEILEGDGSTPNLLGTANLSSVQSQACGSDPVPDAIFKAFVAVRATGFAEPTVLFINPNDWQDIRLLRTADGIYIFGSPNDPGAERIWGKPVVQSTFVTENTAYTGDYAMHSMLFMKRGIDFQVTNAHSDYFTKGKQAIRADMRCSMVHFRDTAFCKITGI